MSPTTDDRFQVLCSYCGLLSSATNLIDAIALATRAKSKHNSPDEIIEIFDLMAHIGCAEIYTNSGKPRHYKAR